MKTVVWHGTGDIRRDSVAGPRIREATDAVVRITRSAICGTDLHFVRGTMAPMQEGAILGHTRPSVSSKRPVPTCAASPRGSGGRLLDVG